MTQGAVQQIQDLVAKSARILIVTKRQFSVDGVASALALLLTFKKLNKNAEIIIDGFKEPGNLLFLPSIKEIKAGAKKLKKFIIDLDIAQTGLEDLSYDIQGSTLRIHLSPKQGIITPEDLKFASGDFAYDLIVAVDVQDLELLGSLYDYHRDLFYKVPVINIDHQANNDYFGHLNLVDLTAAANGEILFKFFKKWQPELIDEDVANCLLTGIVSKTKSFKTPNVTPEVLATASELIKLGANRKAIVINLFQVKTIGTLKLWGKILSRLESDLNDRLVWSKLDLHDFTESGAAQKDAFGVIDELISTNPLAEVIILFYQTEPGQTKVMLHAQGSRNALGLARQFFATGDKNDAFFNLEFDLNTAEVKVLEAVKNQLIG